jgi:uncharacterized NAD(P)/FAD-binding protein YdhS
MHHTDMPRIAIVGGGFSGTLVLAHLVQHARRGFSIELFEPRDCVGTGTAYGAAGASHLLNVRAERMGAYGHDPKGFYDWLQTPEGKAQAEALWPQGELTGESYVPRALYGAYLRQILEGTLALARKKGVEVHIHNAHVVNAVLQDVHTQRLMLTIERGGLQQEMLVHYLVLATGNLTPRRFSYHAGLIRGAEHYVEDVWHTDADHLFPHKVGQLPADSDIVILGTGQTMADTVLTLKAHGFKGTVTALSRNGWLPQVQQHAKPYPQWQWHADPASIPATVLGLFVRLRQEVKAAAQQGYDWRSVMDSIRPITQDIWKRLKIDQKRKFLSRVFTLWNIHRHRMAPAVYTELKPMLQSGALKIVAGKMYYAGSDEDGLTVAYRKRGANRIETIRTPLLLNCTGPEYDIAGSHHRLLKNLRDQELITVGPLRMGIELSAQNTAKGRAQNTIFPAGSLLVGELLECTAVQELRVQAEQVAMQLLQQLEAHTAPGVTGDKISA